MKTAIVDGARLKVLLGMRGVRQRELAAKVGVTHYNVSRWCQRGEHAVKRENLAKIACALGMSYEALMEEVASKNVTADGVHLTSAEADWLLVFRKLSPLEQARVRVAVDDMVSKKRASR